MRFLFASALAISLTGTRMGILNADNIGLIPQLLRQEGYTHAEWMLFWDESVGNDYIAAKRHLLKLGDHIPAELRQSYLSALVSAFDRIESYRSFNDVSGDHSGGNGRSRKKERPYSYLFFLTASNLYFSRTREFSMQSSSVPRVMMELFFLVAHPHYAIEFDRTTQRHVGVFDWIIRNGGGSEVPKFTTTLVTAYATDLVRANYPQAINTVYGAPPGVGRLIIAPVNLSNALNIAIFVCVMNATLIPARDDFLEFLRVRNWWHNGWRSTNDHEQFQEPASYNQCARLVQAPMSARGG